MRHLFLLILFIYCQTSLAQGFKVSSLKTNLSDLSASTQQRTDAEGLACGLIKVQTKVVGVEFGGNVVGNVENKTNEYWVYLPKGAKELLIMRPDYLPLFVNLAEHGVDAIDSKTTYTMVLKEVNLNPEKCGVTIHVKPREAQVKIDDMDLKQHPSGDYKVLLPKGEHLVRIDAPGHKPDFQMITTSKGVQDINVELESLMADVNIISQTGTAEIFVDEKSMGVGGWKGKMIPGKHVVEVRQEGYVTVTNQVTIAEKEQKTITISKLSPVVGTLNIKTTPNACTVYLDGEEVEKSPCTIKDVVYGSHQLLIKLDSCGLQRQKEYDIHITDDRAQTVTCELATEKEMKTYATALEWFIKGFQSNYSILRSWPAEETKDCYDCIMNMINQLDKSFFAQVVHPLGDGEPGNSHVTPFYYMFMYYCWPRWWGIKDYTEDDDGWMPERFVNNPDHPNKALLLMEKMGWESIPDDIVNESLTSLIENLAAIYILHGDIMNPAMRDLYNKKNKTKALGRYQKALEIITRHFHDDSPDSKSKYNDIVNKIRQKIQKLQ